MKPKIIDGKATANTIKAEITAEVLKMIETGVKTPHLAAILVGNDPASETYVSSKSKSCHEVGFISSLYKENENISEKELLKLIDFMNNDEDIDGFIVQLPLPKHINTQKVMDAISPLKDIDGFHPVNLGRMLMNNPSYLPATPYGIMLLLERYGIETEGKNCVVLGRSNIVGTPMSVLLSRNANPGNCTVTLCHSKTKNIKEICAQADILVVAIGKPEFVTADMVKNGAVVIDVGIHRVDSSTTKSGFKLIGDVKYDEVAPKCSFITPVPGGVGPMTIAALLLNTLKAAKKEFSF
ncbi:MAG: bifunctional methylenetetrahydrofolate dehydrogenase/methenyltetrahydrofolate cyclohydrolase FolD [Bacteroidales bacterium]|nr:bifunctional methylenetetrahydrofolate dehydrogenase/methenyltetrahydrofolate cyclohydrolase FolD [Bacteroidales bacterium]